MSTKSRSIRLILLISFFGCLIGTILNKNFIFILPKETIISRFFVDSTTIIKLPDNFGIDLGILKTGISFQFEIGVLSLIGILVSWYFLRYFR